jgi:hypothetical protein
MQHISDYTPTPKNPPKSQKTPEITGPYVKETLLPRGQVQSNLERLRHHGRRDNRSVTYTADWKKYSRCIADRIDEKTKLAKKWEVTPIYLLVWVSNPVPTTPFSDYVVEAGLLIDSVSPFVKLVIGNPGQIYISS